MRRGYIAMARGILDHPLVGARKPYSAFEAWSWLITEAAWKERRVRASNGRAEFPVTIQRGQVCYSLRYMAKAWGWSKKRVCTFLDRLENDTQIETQKGTPQTLITICNYEAYQSPGSYKETPKGTQKGTQRGQNRRR